MQYGYTGTISTEWRSQNDGADKLAHVVATQLLIWETVVGERDADFNKVSTGGYDAVLNQVSADHPLRSQIMHYYNSIAASVQTHSKPGVELTYEQMKSLFRTDERAGQHLTGYIVFSPDNFKMVYSPESRTYAVSSENKAFEPNKGGYSIYADSIDGSDSNVRIEKYMAAEQGGQDGWKIERCYMMEGELERARSLEKRKKTESDKKTGTSRHRLAPVHIENRMMLA